MDFERQFFKNSGRSCDAADSDSQFFGNFGRSCDAVGSERQFFGNLGRSCDAVDSERQFSKNFGRSCDAVDSERQFCLANFRGICSVVVGLGGRARIARDSARSPHVLRLSASRGIQLACEKSGRGRGGSGGRRACWPLIRTAAGR